MKDRLRIALCISLLILLVLPAQANDKARLVKNDWRGWWFLYHPDAEGRLVLDKFIVAIAIDADVHGRPAKGMWVGCAWSPAERLQYRKDHVSVIFSKTGAFTMTRTGPDEARGSFSAKPTYIYVARRESGHGECAGYHLTD